VRRDLHVGTGENCGFNTMIEIINNGLGADVDPEYVENPEASMFTTR